MNKANGSGKAKNTKAGSNESMDISNLLDQSENKNLIGATVVTSIG